MTYLSSTLNCELMKISDWLKANKLSLNLKKTKYIAFTPRQKRLHFNFQLAIDNQPINQVTETAFLGVILDKNLTWKPHISHIANKISKSIGIIYRSKFYLPKKSLITLYYSLIYPYLFYCNMVWASTYETNLHRIVILQKRAIRIISKSNFDDHTSPIFKSLGILKFHDIHIAQISQFMYSYTKSLLPDKFCNIFSTHRQIHSHNTRYALNFCLPLCRINISKFSVLYQGPKLYNTLDEKIKNCTSLFV